ncbi:hypothetical protein B9G55_05845 [Saccharibacillus sp. O16]|nr:hypothetical protein B9G55_05845 [Saccharibacillus sp. O16]
MGSRQGLLIVDVQNVMFDEQWAVHQGQEVVDRIAGLLEQARASEAPIVFIRHTEEEGPMVEGSEGWQIHEKLTPRPGEVILQKTVPDSFHETGLDDRLQELDVDRLVIVGMQTDYCINATTRRAAELGYRTILVQDGHTTIDTEHETAAAIIDRHHHELKQIEVELQPAADITF